MPLRQISSADTESTFCSQLESTQSKLDHYRRYPRRQITKIVSESFVDSSQRTQSSQNPSLTQPNEVNGIRSKTKRNNITKKPQRKPKPPKDDTDFIDLTQEDDGDDNQQANSSFSLLQRANLQLYEKAFKKEFEVVDRLVSRSKKQVDFSILEKSSDAELFDELNSSVDTNETRHSAVEMQLEEDSSAEPERPRLHRDATPNTSIQKEDESKSTYYSSTLSPLHTKLLAARLHLNEYFLAQTIKETYEQSLLQDTESPEEEVPCSQSPPPPPLRASFIALRSQLKK